MLILVTGATGKVGRRFIAGLLDDPRFSKARVRALCHNRLYEATDRVDVIQGSIADRDVVAAALDAVTHVVHLATCKETPEDIMDVTVKGLFWLLEEFRTSVTARQFILIGGDAGVGHFHHRHDGPITENARHSAYRGSYALSKVLEEVMLEQFGIQYGLNGCCLRAPWIMEKDDFKYSLSFGDDVFGGPDWKTLVPEDAARRYAAMGTVPLLLDADGRPLKRNFVHVDDLVSAILAAIDNPGQSGNSSISAWIDQSTMLKSQPISCVRAISAPSTYQAASIPIGWTTAKRNTCWIGGQTTISKCLSTQPGNTSVRRRSLASSGIRVDFVWRARGVRLFQGRKL